MALHYSQIQEFFANQTVFLTGGSGFLGKILIEKLLRQCKAIDKIYVLMRAKNSKSSNERFQQLFDFPCFDLLKKTGINYKEKVFLVEGDCLQPNLGLDQNSLNLLQTETTCVIHAAANVKFDQTLKEAAFNVRATRDLLSLAKEMKNLKAFIHVSTAYSNCIHTVVKEKFYEPPMTADQLLTIVEGLDDQILEAITPDLLGKWPNTYVYTKCISEDLVKNADFPISVVRPAIVVSTSEEPFPGWIDNFYGVVGIVMAAALGLIRSLHAKYDSPAFVVPVDYVANVVLAAAWNISNCPNATIYNFYGHRKNILTWRDVHVRIEPLCWKAPSDKVLWYYSFKMRENLYWHKFCVFFLHTVQAYIVDFFLFCIGRPRLAVENYRRLDKMLDLISYFSTRTWYIDDDNLMKMWEDMSDEDKKLFNFYMENLDYDKFALNAIFGARKFLLKDTPESIARGEKKLKILFVAHYTVVGLFWLLVFKLIMIMLNFLFKRV